MRTGLRVVIILAIIAIPAASFAQAIHVADLAFVDDLHGWVSVTEPSPAILRTSDGGETWTRIPVPGFYRITFFDANTGLGIQSVSDSEFAIHRTVDGGSTWEKVATVKEPYLHAVAAEFISTDDAFVLAEGSGGSGWIGQLSSGGHTLRVRTDVPVDFATQSNTLGIFGDGTGHIWIVGKQLVLHSADKGKTWENQYQNTAPHIDLGESGTAVPGGHAWFAAANWDIYRTDDYGKHWVRALTTAKEGQINFDSVSFYDSTDGCAVSGSSFIYCTHDGGLTWSHSKVFDTYLIGSPYSSKILLFPSQRGWTAVAGELYKTDDGGKSFRKLFGVVDAGSSVPGESQALQTSVNGPHGLAYDNGYLYIAEMIQDRLLRLDVLHSSIKTLLPPPEDRDFSNPHVLASDGHGTIWIGDHNGRLRRLDTRTGEVTTIATESVWKPEMMYPSGMAFTANGTLIVSTDHHLLRWNILQQKWEMFAGSSAGFSGDGGPASAARFTFAMGVAVNTNGDIYVADYENCRLRKIEHEKQVVSTVAGTGVCKPGGGDGGPAILATMSWPQSMAIDRKNNVFFIDGNRIRRIDVDGIITTYAGTGEAGFGGDDGPADKAKLNNPSGLAVDPDGNLYIGEFVNNRIRRVDAVTHTITTVAGNGLPHRIDVQM